MPGILNFIAKWFSPSTTSRNWVEDIKPMLPRPLFRPYSEWDESDPPRLSASDYEKHKSMRQLDQAYALRAQAIRRHKFEI